MLAGRPNHGRGRTVFSRYTGSVASEVAFVTDDFAGGSGTDADPYVIETWNHLDAVRDHRGDAFVLEADLDDETDGYADAVPWTPIGSETSPFDGTIDGGGHEIAQLHCDEAGEDYVGFVASVDFDGAVERLGLVGPSVTGGRKVGTIAGANRGTVFHCYASGSASGEEPDLGSTFDVGGLVGHNRSGGLIEQCYATGTAAADFAVGGLVGTNEADVVETYYNDVNQAGIGEADGDTGETTGLSVSEMTGDAAEGNMTDFDFETTWQTVTGGTPTLRAPDDGEPVAVSATGETIAVGGQAEVSVSGTAVTDVTLSALWTDWDVTPMSDADGTFSDDVGASGSCQFVWTEPQSSVSPTISVAPPERYVGGEYRLSVTATDGSDVAETTATIVIDDDG